MSCEKGHELSTIDCGLFYCHMCNQWYDIPLTRGEIKTLYELLERQYISYENVAALELVKKLRNIVDDMAR